MKTYTFKLVITEGCDEFWENLEGTGCNEVTDAIKMALEDQGWLNDENSQLTLQEYKDDGK